MMNIYLASKTKYAPQWLRLRARGFPITCSWLTRFEAYDYAHLPDVAEQCLREAMECDALVLYATAGDELRGAFMETGAAIASGRPVWLVNAGRWTEENLPDLLRHPQVTVTCCVEHALKYAIRDLERKQKPLQSSLRQSEAFYLVSREPVSARPDYFIRSGEPCPARHWEQYLRSRSEARVRSHEVAKNSEAIVE
jgi:hypothetical protein